MHEVAFAKVVLRDIESIKDRDKEISEVIIELGELVGIESEHLIEGLKGVSDYKYKVIIKESLIKCPCGYEGRAEVVERLHDSVIWKCPWCDDSIETMEVLEGDKIKIVKIVYK